MSRVVCFSWEEYRNRLLGFASLSRDRREQLIFRGQASSDWKLDSTLDRNRRFEDDLARDRYNTRLLDEFRRESIRFVVDPSNLPQGDAFELLARHHGLPSPLIDWTTSPYIAAYFAYEEAKSESVAVWVLDRARCDPIVNPDFRSVEFIDDFELLRYNRRALQQRGIFMRVLSGRQSIEELLRPALTKFELRVADRSQALADLDAMTISSASLFADLDSAARTAVHRISSAQEGDH